ncbi:hypothetical protein ACF1BQ_018800 [Bradyrhizobium sp. RDT10]
MQRYLAGIDIGGTFTDVVLIDRGESSRRPNHLPPRRISPTA